MIYQNDHCSPKLIYKMIEVSNFSDCPIYIKLQDLHAFFFQGLKDSKTDRQGLVGT